MTKNKLKYIEYLKKIIENMYELNNIDYILQNKYQRNTKDILLYSDLLESVDKNFYNIIQNLK